MIHKITILYVEDEKGMRTQLTKFLKNFSTKLFVAVDGEDGLEQYKKYTPDLVISDIQMPKLNGIEMVKDIKNIKYDQHIIFTTAFSDSGYFIDAIDLSVDGYILKPIDLEKLELKLEHITKQINLKKEIEYQKSITNEIAKLQDNLLVVLDEYQNMIYSNEKFLEFFSLNHIKEFKTKYNRLGYLFLENDDFFTPKGSGDKDWIKEIQTLEDSKRVVMILNTHTFTPHSFLVSIKTIKDTDHTIIVFTEITTITLEKKEFQHKAFSDELTGIYNRTYFNQELEKQIAIYKRDKTPLSFFILDIDKFKDFNDTYGHQTGDEILKSLAQIINKNTRAADTFARWGGEEFVKILPNSSLEQSVKVANNIREMIQNHTFVDGLKVTCSFGVSTFKDNDTAESLMKRADDALYRAKENGRNRVESENQDE